MSDTKSTEPRDLEQGGRNASGGTPKAAVATQSSVVPQFALDAANRQVARVSDVLTGAAQSIDDLIINGDLPLPDSVRGFATTASEELRALADRANEEEAGKLLEGLQRAAADNPATTIGIGAAIGAALGLALSKLGRADGTNDSTPTK